MKKVINFTTLCCTILSFVATAQNYSGDAFKFSQNSNITGSSRMQAIGGEHAAIGADVTNISGNPAGLGMYSRSEFSITGGLYGLNTNTNYINTNTNNTRNNFNLGNIAMVFGGENTRNNVSSNSGWKSGNFGFSYNRNFNLLNSFAFNGRNNKSSLADSYAELVNFDNRNTGAYLDSQEQFNADNRVAQSPEALYYQMYLIESVDGKGNVPFKRFDFLNPSPTDQQGTFEAEGRTSNWNFAYGANYNDKLFLGVSAGIAGLKYDFANNQTDSFVGGSIFNSFSSTQSLTVSGRGLNVNAGLIYRPNNALRIGATLHSPTWYSISESYDQGISASVKASNKAGIPADLRSATVAPYDFDYTLATPLRASAGAAFFVGKSGFISADAEFVGYSGMKLGSNNLSSSDNLAFRNDNKRNIKADYKDVVNLKVGGELRFNAIALRAGVNYFADPYKIKYDNIDRNRLAYSVGAGYKSNSFYLDVTGSFTSFKSAFTPYTLNNPADYASAQIDNKVSNVSFTLGTYF